MTDPSTSDSPAANAATTQSVGLFLNILMWVDGIPEFRTAKSEDELRQSFFMWACRGEEAPTLERLTQRYLELNKVGAEIPAALAEVRVLSRVLRPLLQAKCAFVLGHDLSCIAMCGMVGEMLAVLKHDSWSTITMPSAKDPEKQKKILGHPFDKLGQARRIDVLHGLGLINDGTAADLKNLASLRNRYLHSFQHPYDQLRTDAKRAFQIAVKGAREIVGVIDLNGVPSADSAMIAYLQQAGAPTGPAPKV